MRDLGEIGFSDEQGSLLDVATAFCREKSPVSKVRRLMEDERGHDPAVWGEMVELGWLGIAIPEEFGGAGLSLAEVVPVMEQMGRALLAGPFMSTTLAAQAILAGATESQRQAWLPKLATGAVGTLALVEAGGDGMTSPIRCAATPVGEDRLRLSGVKILVSDAAEAQVILASVRFEGAPALVLIEAGQAPRGALRRERIIDETRRACSVTLDGMEILRDQLLAPERAEATLAHVHLAANLLSAAEMCGGTQAVIDTTLDYARTRKQFGQPIGAYQAVKHPLVEAYLRYEQARSHLYAAAHSFGEQGAGEIAVRMAKVAADHAFAFAADRAIQFHGGFGFTWDCDAQLYRRRALWHASQYGDSLYHKKKLAELLL
jgi:alkylation response protein AidB-like acyl-CoA dehydrogenase